MHEALRKFEVPFNLSECVVVDLLPPTGKVRVLTGHVGTTEASFSPEGDFLNFGEAKEAVKNLIRDANPPDVVLIINDFGYTLYHSSTTRQ